MRQDRRQPTKRHGWRKPTIHASRHKGIPETVPPYGGSCPEGSRPGQASGGGKSPSASPAPAITGSAGRRPAGSETGDPGPPIPAAGIAPKSNPNSASEKPLRSTLIPRSPQIAATITPIGRQPSSASIVGVLEPLIQIKPQVLRRMPLGLGPDRLLDKAPYAVFLLPGALLLGRRPALPCRRASRHARLRLGRQPRLQRHRLAHRTRDAREHQPKIGPRADPPPRDLPGRDPARHRGLDRPPAPAAPHPWPAASRSRPVPPASANAARSAPQPHHRRTNLPPRHIRSQAGEGAKRNP